MKAIKLKRSNLNMPIIGLGTWQDKAEEIEKAVETALESGYRHIDTAFNYNTEKPIGNVLKRWMEHGKIKREDIFITTKLPNFGNRPSDVEKFVNLSLERLQLNYIDLYLIHMPFTFHMNEEKMSPLVKENGEFSLDIDVDYVDTWREMEKQVLNGKIKALGVSNFNPEQLERIYNAASVKPDVIQVELHAYFQQKALRQMCECLGVAITAYAPLGSPGTKFHLSNKYNYHVEDFPDILSNPEVKKLSIKYGKLPAQILLRHLMEKGIIIIPKSANPERIRSNIDIFNFALDPNDVEILNGLDRDEAGRIFDFLFFKGVEQHPHYPFKLKN